MMIDEVEKILISTQPLAESVTEFRMFTIDLKSDSESIEVICHKSVLLSSTDIDSAKEEALAMDGPDNSPKTISTLLPILDTQWDINVPRRMHIFLRLNPKKNWRFSNTRNPVELKPNQVIDATYGGFERLFAKGSTDCKIVGFSVDPPSRRYDDSFDFHIEIFEDGMVLPIAVDPDIKHPGGTE